MPDFPLTPRLEELLARKLEIEIEKLSAERTSAQIEARNDERDEIHVNSHPGYSRIYNFVGGVTKESAKEAMLTLSRWSRRDPEGDITFVFNSPGGSVTDGLALFDCIEELKEKGHHVTTVARGMAASMGGVLLQGGHERIIGKNAHVLIHEVSSLNMGKLSELEDEIEFCKKLQGRILSILAERSTYSERQIKNKWTRKDWWLDADETVKLGFADRIG